MYLMKIWKELKINSQYQLQYWEFVIWLQRTKRAFLGENIFEVRQPVAKDGRWLMINMNT